MPCHHNFDLDWRVQSLYADELGPDISWIPAAIELVFESPVRLLAQVFDKCVLVISISARSVQHWSVHHTGTMHKGEVMRAPVRHAEPDMRGVTEVWSARHARDCISTHGEVVAHHVNLIVH